MQGISEIHHLRVIKFAQNIVVFDCQLLGIANQREVNVCTVIVVKTYAELVVCFILTSCHFYPLSASLFLLRTTKSRPQMMQYRKRPKAHEYSVVCYL